MHLEGSFTRRFGLSVLLSAGAIVGILFAFLTLFGQRQLGVVPETLRMANAIALQDDDVSKTCTPDSVGTDEVIYVSCGGFF